VLRVAFSDWLRDETGIRLDATTEWRIHGERPRNARRKFFPDMIWESEQLELWFEHKLRSRLKPREVAVYLEEAHRLMFGSSDEESHTAPTDFEAAADRPVAVFVITGRSLTLSEDLRAWNDAFPRLQRGLAWAGDAGCLRWHAVHAHLTQSARGLTGFDGEVAASYLDWLGRELGPPTGGGHSN